jgi:hypothetical protein
MVQRGSRAENTIGRTHVAIGDNIPPLSARELVTRSGETLDELFLQTKRVSRVSEYCHVRWRDLPLQLTGQTAPLWTLDHSLLWVCGERVRDTVY